MAAGLNYWMTAVLPRVGLMEWHDALLMASFCLCSMSLNTLARNEFAALIVTLKGAE